MERCLIVNADDFGLSAGVNRGIMEAHERGIVTSASLMVRGPAAAEAAAYARDRAAFSLGLHVDLGEWVFHNKTWTARYEVVAQDDPVAVKDEVARQLAAFRTLAGRDPTHLDSHQHVHRAEPLRSILLDLARALAVPLRHFTPAVRHCGAFYGQSGKGEAVPGVLSADNLIRILKALPPGVTELGCHPGRADDLASPYRSEREEEVRVLCEPRVRAALEAERITLRSF